jgi:hypothetical protein
MGLKAGGNPRPSEARARGTKCSCVRAVWRRVVLRVLLRPCQRQKSVAYFGHGCVYLAGPGSHIFGSPLLPLPAKAAFSCPQAPVSISAGPDGTQKCISMSVGFVSPGFVGFRGFLLVQKRRVIGVKYFFSM